jgi:hypothetical protein
MNKFISYAVGLVALVSFAVGCAVRERRIDINPEAERGTNHRPNAGAGKVPPKVAGDLAASTELQSLNSTEIHSKDAENIASMRRNSKVDTESERRKEFSNRNGGTNRSAQGEKLETGSKANHGELSEAGRSDNK